jgi:hypothetical protein
VPAWILRSIPTPSLSARNWWDNRES